MAVTVVSNAMTASLPMPEATIRLSGLTAGATETISFPVPGRPALCAVGDVQIKRVVTEATALSPVFIETWASDEANNQFTVKFDTIPTGDLTGMVLDLKVVWAEHARQDGESIDSDNDD
jgi:hypothetical protein